MRYDQLAAQLRAPMRADMMPGGPMGPMDDPADTPEQDDVPNDADLQFVTDYLSLVQQEIKLCNAILLQGASDDVAAWALEELMDSTEDLLELKDILADLLEDQADGGADEDTEMSKKQKSSAARAGAKRKAGRRSMMKNKPAAY